MTGGLEQKAGCPDELRVFTFVMMGVRIGVDADQIAEVLDVDAAEALGLPLCRFHERIPFGERPVVYHAPKAIKIKNEGAPYLVVIDRPDDIVVISVRSIQPIPPVISGPGSSRPLWGAVAEKSGIILLVDFSRRPARTDD
jgi:hypothetical protein